MPAPRVKELVRGWALPVGGALGRVGVGPDAITWLGLLLAAVAGILLMRGSWIAAFFILLASSLCDLLDGAVARATGRGSRFGAALDSTIDRYAEAVVLIGILVYHASMGAPIWLYWLWGLALTASFLVSYIRARAEGLGVSCEVGFLERPERLVLVMLLCLIGPRGTPWILGLLAAAGHVTAAQRLIHVKRALKGRA